MPIIDLFGSNFLQLEQPEQLESVKKWVARQSGAQVIVELTQGTSNYLGDTHRHSPREVELSYVIMAGLFSRDDLLPKAGVELLPTPSRCDSPAMAGAKLLFSQELVARLQRQHTYEQNKDALALHTQYTAHYATTLGRKSPSVGIAKGTSALLGVVPSLQQNPRLHQWSFNTIAANLVYLDSELPSSDIVCGILADFSKNHTPAVVKASSRYLAEHSIKKVLEGYVCNSILFNHAYRALDVIDNRLGTKQMSFLNLFSSAQ